MARGGDEDIVGLEVPVHVSLLVHVVQGVEGLRSVEPRRREGKRPLVPVRLPHGGSHAWPEKRGGRAEKWVSAVQKSEK